MPRARRAVLVSAAIAGAAAVGIALVDCGSVSLSDAGAFPAGDGGGGDGSNPGLDSGPLPDAFVTPQSHAMITVNASPDLDDIRLCVAIAGPGARRWITKYAIPDDVNAPMPQSNYPGVPRGGGVVLPGIHELTTGSVTVFAVRASTVLSDVPGNANARQCGDLICTTGAGAGCLTANADYFELPDVGPLPFADSSYLLAITGCVPSLFDPAGSPARCGATYSSGGNLGLAAAKLDTSAHADPNELGAQVAQLAPGIADALLADAGGDAGLTVGYGALGDDAGAPLAASLRYLDISTLVSREVPSLFASVGVSVSVDGQPTPVLALTLATIQKLTDPTKLPDQFFRGRTNYLFAIVGDPTAAQQLTTADGGLNPAYDGHGLHIIALPTTLDGGTL